jgi:hypothetical protein
LKNTKMIIAGYSPNRNWWNLIGTTSTTSAILKKSTLKSTNSHGIWYYYKVS